MVSCQVLARYSRRLLFCKYIICNHCPHRIAIAFLEVLQNMSSTTDADLCCWICAVSDNCKCSKGLSRNVQCRIFTLNSLVYFPYFIVCLFLITVFSPYPYEFQRSHSTNSYDVILANYFIYYTIFFFLVTSIF